MILGVDTIISGTTSSITEDRVTLICELSCFSPGLQCLLYQATILNDINVDVTNAISNITGSVMSYDYPIQSITLSGLNKGTTYNYCIIGINMTNMMYIGEQNCGNFTTITTNGKYKLIIISVHQRCGPNQALAKSI